MDQNEAREETPEAEVSPGETVTEQASQGQRPEADRAEEYLGALQRLKADFDNYRRRVNQDQGRWGEMAVAGFVVQVLPVVDNLERALGAAGDSASVRQGVELTLRQLREVLSGVGVQPMESVGTPFDPARHEAVARGPASGMAPGTVAEEYRKGYLLRDEVLRPALVRVAAEVDQAEADTADAEEGEH